MTAKVQLYGRLIGGNDSYAVISRGMRDGLAAHGRLANFVDQNEAADSDGIALGYDAPVGVFVGPPAQSSFMRFRGRHRHRLALIAPNSSWLPHETMSTIHLSCTALIAPSRWGVDVIERHVELPVLLWHHGVDRELLDVTAPPDAVAPGAQFRAVHFSSTFHERKGTRELVEAWGIAMREGRLPPESLLTLVVAGARGLYLEMLEQAGCSRSVLLESPVNLPPAQLAVIMREFHRVVQPSRGEGFGLVPLEALVAGVRVIATGATGHADHVGQGGEGITVTPTGPDAPIDDGPGAMAPTVSPEDIAVDLENAAHGPLGPVGWVRRRDLFDHWSWEAVTGRFLRSLDALFAEEDIP